jgi:hypothetical protein
MNPQQEQLDANDLFQIDQKIIFEIQGALNNIHDEFNAKMLGLKQYIGNIVKAMVSIQEQKKQEALKSKEDHKEESPKKEEVK